jgi:putative FmdB family regulatory protein
MPIYEYKCLKCRHEFQAMQKFSDAPVHQCPTCGAPVKKLISRSSFHLKGSGWYLTDYAKKGSPKGSDSEGSSSSSDSTPSPSGSTSSSDKD